MAISVAIQNGDWVTLYDENGTKICDIAALGKLIGYTATTISIKRDNHIALFDMCGVKIRDIAL